jgi:hypothetical protein
MDHSAPIARLRLENQVGVVTGGTRGIGEGIVRRFVEAPEIESAEGAFLDRVVDGSCPRIVTVVMKGQRLALELPIVHLVDVILAPAEMLCAGSFASR